MKTITIILAMMFCSIGAMAEEPKSVQTHDFYTKCNYVLDDVRQQSEHEATQGTFCLGYVRGFADGLNLFATKFWVQGSAEALVRSFVNYVNSHPAEMDAESLDRVLFKAWVVDRIIHFESDKQ
jgi:hypothetical protein